MIVVWRITTHCNLRCAFCAYDRSLPTRRAEAVQESVLRFTRLLADYRARTDEPVMVSWLGGEPLLWKPLQTVSRALAELGLQTSATTNGTALKSPALRGMIADHFDELTVSLDGPQQFHDAIRRWPGGFEQLREGIAMLRASPRGARRQLRLRVNTVLMTQNVRSFPSLCDELLSWGIDEITFNQLGGYDRPEFYPAHRLSLADIDWLASMLPELRERLQLRGVRLAGGAQYLQRFRASAQGEQLPVASCQPGKDFLFVDEHGRIAPCSFTVADYASSIDELHSVDDLIALSGRYEQLAARRRSRWCDDCPSTRVFEKFVA